MRDLRLNERNKYRAQWEFATGQPDVASTPPILQIARTNTCNFKCVYCGDHREGNTIPRYENSGETWKQLLELIPRSEQLSFHGISEFMMDPEFFDVVGRCRDAQARLFINTNGSVCGPKYLELLGNYTGILVMNFSLDAATAETFLRIRGWRFERVISNIRSYVERFNSRRHPTWLSVSFVITKSNIGEVTDFVHLAHELKMNQVKFVRLLEYGAFDWNIPTKAGGSFDYRGECADQFGEEFNRKLDEARTIAEEYGLSIDIPAHVPVAPLDSGDRA